MKLAGSAHILAVAASITPPWRKALGSLILVVAWMLFLYRDTGVAMVSIWARSDTFAHAFLVPPIAFWLAWRQRHRIAAHTPRPSAGAVVLIACAALTWLLADLAAVNAVSQLALVALLVLAVPAALGLPVARVILFPLGFLFFAVPIGEFLMPQLMEWTANFTVLALRLSGIPVYREGLQFVIPSGNWSVVEACSGVRYLIASLTVGTLFAYLNYQSFHRRVLFVIISVLVPVLANWMRAFLIVMLGHASGNKLAAGVDHLVYGWLFFGVVIILMFAIGARWAEHEQAMILDGLEPGTGLPLVTDARRWTATASLAVVVALPHAALLTTGPGEAVSQPPFEPPQTLASNWRVVPPGRADFKPAFHNPLFEINSRYANHDHTVGLYLGYYRHQNGAHKLVSSNNVLVVSHDPQWAIASSGSRRIELAGQQVAVRTSELRATGMAGKPHEDRLAVWQFYWVNGTLTASDYLAKAYGAFYRLTGRGDDSAAVIVYTDKDQAGSTEAVLQSFLSNNYAFINELMLKVKNNR